MQWRVLLLLASGCSFSSSVRGDNAEVDAPVAIDAAIDAPDMPPPPTTFLLRIDAGNTAANFVDSAGVTWVKDTYCTGDLATDPGAVRNTSDDALYDTAFYKANANVTCTIAGLPSAMFRVTFYGAELWVGGSQDCNVGQQRTMDISLEGSKVANDLNIWTLTGGCAIDGGGNTGTPYVKSYDLMITDGTLDIVLGPGNAGQRDPMIQALEIREL